MSETRPTVILRREAGHRFRVVAGEGEPFVVDEAPPLGGGQHPNPLALVATAVGECLSSSLLHCFDKARLDVASLETRVTPSVHRNDAGRLRIARLDVEIRVETKDGAERANRCLRIFEDYCTVTATLRAAFPIDVVVRDAAGIALHTTSTIRAPAVR